MSIFHSCSCSYFWTTEILNCCHPRKNKGVLTLISFRYPGNHGARSAIAVWRSIFEMFFGLGWNDKYSRIHIWVYMRHYIFLCHSFQSVRHYLSTTIFGCIETRVDIKENGTWRFESYDSGGYFWKIQNILLNCETYLRHFHIARLFIFQQMSIEVSWQPFRYKCPLKSHGIISRF